MRNVGTVVRGIRTPIIKEDTNLEDTVIDSIMKAKESEGFEFRDRDIVADADSGCRQVLGSCRCSHCRCCRHLPCRLS